MRALLIALLLTACFPLRAEEAEPSDPPPAYVGSESCVACHGEQAAAWRQSHHARAWLMPDADAVLGDFDGASFEHHGTTYRFLREGDAYAVEEIGPSGEIERFAIESLAGIDPLQQYLVETEPGRLQALDLAWDAERQRWYHLYPLQNLKPGDGLHWSGPYKNWNARCAECHATDYRKRFDPETQSYSSSEAERGVGCEACHGPGAAHLAWVEGKALSDWPGLTAEGFTVDLSAADPERQIQTCAACHSRREPLGDRSPLPGTPFHDSYRLSLLSPGLYHADGTINDEVYVYGSFLQSKMYAEGVRCSDCHEPHSATLKAEGNGVCTQCHGPAGDARFPSLAKKDYDSPAHHFHPLDSAGAQCVACHMIERTYMGIDERRDHSFRVPRPDLAAETGAPNACTDCHGERDSAWAAAAIAERFPDPQHRQGHFGTILASGRADPAAQAEALLDLAAREDMPAIARASALDLLNGVVEPLVSERSAALLSDAEPLVRAAASGLQRAVPPEIRLARLLPLLEDPLRAVRLAAVRALVTAPMPQLTRAQGALLQKVAGDWQASLLDRADFPETHMVLGGLALTLRDPQAAIGGFREAVRLDPQQVAAWIMLVRIHLALGQNAEARQTLQAAMAANPGDLDLVLLNRNLQ